MTATIQIVTINGVDYEVYSDVAYTDEYLNADASADAYRTLDTDGRGRVIVSGRRVLDVQPWAGQKTDPDQEMAWPRSGVFVKGVEIDHDVIPLDIVNANAELANASANGVDIVNFVSTANIQRRIKAGSVEIENFRMPPSQYLVFPLPQPAWVLISKYMGGAGAASTIKANGTCGRSILDRPFDHTTGI